MAINTLHRKDKSFDEKIELKKERVSTPDFTAKLQVWLDDLADNEKLEISKNGVVKKSWIDQKTKKRHTRNLGNLFYNDEEMVKLSSKIPYAGAMKKTFYGMENQPKTEKLPPVNQLTLGLFLFELGKNPKAFETQNFEKQFYTEYRTIQIDNFKGYYNKNGRLVYIKTENELYSIPPKYTGPKTEVMGYCDSCKGIFFQSLVKLYKNHTETKCLCKDCKKEYLEFVEVEIK